MIQNTILWGESSKNFIYKQKVLIVRNSIAIQQIKIYKTHGHTEVRIPPISNKVIQLLLFIFCSII